MTIPLSDRILPSAVPAATTDAHSPTAALSAFELQMTELYERVDAVVASHSPVCNNRGLCCKFAAFGHRLYVTEPEIRYFISGLANDWRPADPDRTDCPYQIGGVCTARQHRPLGCRIFFCEERSQAWQGPVYEQFLVELKAIGLALELPYSYREWLSALREGPPPETIDAGPPETLI